jgi:hypothetical protein
MFNITSILSFSRFGELLNKGNNSKMGCISKKRVSIAKLFKLRKMNGIVCILTTLARERKKM